MSEQIWKALAITNTVMSALLIPEVHRGLDYA